MPLYEYECDACGHRFEVIQKSADSPSGTCPKCGGAVHKLQSAPAFQFKGSGWYVTDYAKKDGTKDTKAGTTDTKDTKAGSTETKDTKTDTAEKKETAAPAAAASKDKSTT